MHRSSLYVQYISNISYPNTDKNVHDVSKIAAIIDAIRQARNDEQYNSVYASVYCPFDASMQKKIIQRAADVGCIDLCIIIGIGGSSLGFRAIFDALQNYASINIQNIQVLETVDTAAVNKVLNNIEQFLAKKLRIHIVVISKSGTTTETIALWGVVQPLLQQYLSDEWHKYITIITDVHSPLGRYASNNNIAILTIPILVGGRYSVLSAVGLFPLLLCGIPIDTLIKGAQNAIVDFLASPDTSMPINHAHALLAAYHNGYLVHDTFIFSTWCTAIGLWYRQLAAESLGKKRIHDKKIVDMIPTVSIGSTDLHAIGQLYLSGARNFWTTFIHMQEKNSPIIQNSLIVPDSELKNRSLNDVMHAIVEGTLQAYKSLSISHTIITLSERSPYAVGYLMQSYMLSIMYAGTLLDVNPFDQPDVERYKKITRALLYSS